MARSAMNQAIDRLVTESKPEEAGLCWNEKNDLISGSTGIGLTLLNLAQRLPRPGLIALATKARFNRLSADIRDARGWHWAYDLMK